MKSAYGSRPSPTLAYGKVFGYVDEWVAQLLYEQRLAERAPCRNRTYNLMIKSQIRASRLTRTEGVYLGFQATKDAELVPTTHPKRARSIHGFSPEPM